MHIITWRSRSGKLQRMPRHRGKIVIRQVIRTRTDTVTPAAPISPSSNGRRSKRRSPSAAIERFRARQIFRWIYRRGVTDLDAMTDLSRELRATLAGEFTLTTPAIVARERSVDGTEKFLLRLADGRQIESVFIPDTPAMTFCISTQVGCAMACAFCLTGKMGLVRNLTAGEIVGQVRVLAGALDMRDKPFNIVLMGMGEPLHNYDETMKALRILRDEHGFALSPRRVTLSTVGLLPALERLAREPLMPNLAISLHAPTDAQRGDARAAQPEVRRRGDHRRLPALSAEEAQPDHVRVRAARRRERLAGGRAAAREAAGGREVEGEPDSAERRAPGIPFERPSDEASIASRRFSPSTASTVSVRKSRGRDIRAACGQLIVEGPEEVSRPAARDRRIRSTRARPNRIRLAAR